MTLKETILLTHEYYSRGGAPLSDQVLLMYASDLEDLNPKDCIDAYNRYRRNPANKSFPLPAQIRELVNPEEFVAVETQAREVAARIVGAVSRFGWNNAREAQTFIGAEGWEVVKRQGGWSYLCENMGHRINATTFQAQLRDQLEGVLRYGLPAIEKAIGLPPSNPRIGSLEKASGIAALIPERDDDPGVA